MRVLPTLLAALPFVFVVPVRAEEEPGAAAAKRFEDLLARLPAERFDVEAFARTLAPGIEPAFTFVRDEVAVEAYPGILRGAEGAFRARAANAFDRSLLLARLLKTQGIATRLVTGRLANDAVDRLFERMFAPRAGAGAPTGALAQRVHARAERDLAAVTHALGARPASPGPSSRERALADLTEHAWVQAQRGTEWVDLDASFADAAPGRAYAKAGPAAEGFPAEAYQTVTLRVIEETLGDGGLEKQTRFEIKARVVDVLERPLRLLHVPPDNAAADAIGAAVRAAGGGEAWRPALATDHGVYSGQPVTFRDDASAAATRGAPPGGGLGGAFGPGGALGGGSKGPAFVAEWLELEVRRPGAAPETLQVALVDRAGPAARARGALDAKALRPLPRAGADLTTPREVHTVWLSAGTHDLRGLAQSAAQAASGTVEGQLEAALAPFAVQQATMLALSDHVVVPALRQEGTVCAYLDAPRIYLVTAGPLPGDGTQAFVRGDLRRDTLRVVARTPEHEPRVLATRVRYGVLQGALEHEAALTMGGSRLRTTSGSLGADGTIAVKDAATLASTFPAADDRAVEAAEAVARGCVLAVPRAAVAAGETAWWEVARDGTTRAVMGQGAGVNVDNYNIFGVRRPSSASGGRSGSVGRQVFEYVAMVFLAASLVHLGWQIGHLPYQTMIDTAATFVSDTLAGAADAIRPGPR